MNERNDPVVLQLAHIPREQAGPFLLLGVDKDASKEDIEARWAERVKWARKQQTNTPLEDINWAREQLADLDKRMQADASTPNFDTADGVAAEIARRYGVGGGGVMATWEPIDEEKDLSKYQLPVEVPDPETIRSAIVLPEIPPEVPAATRLLEQVAAGTFDPWSVRL